MQNKINKNSSDTLKLIFDSVGEREGWDFSRMKKERESVPWEYSEIVKKYIKPTDYALDIGTGGGERFIKLSEHFHKGVGIDPYEKMINTAKKNAKINKNKKLIFKLMAAEKLEFPKNTFDIVLNRHAVIVVKEITKVLKPGGYFITEQVTNSNMKNLKQIFKYKKTWKNDHKYLSLAFNKSGLKTLAWGSYNVNYWVKDIESLIFWLKAVDLPENFNINDHGNQLQKYINKYKTPKGFVTNESREFLIVKKD